MSLLRSDRDRHGTDSEVELPAVLAPLLAPREQEARANHGPTLHPIP